VGSKAGLTLGRFFFVAFSVSPRLLLLQAQAFFIVTSNRFLPLCNPHSIPSPLVSSVKPSFDASSNFYKPSRRQDSANWDLRCRMRGGGGTGCRNPKSEQRTAPDPGAELLLGMNGGGCSYERRAGRVAPKGFYRAPQMTVLYDQRCYLRSVNKSGGQ
jgi:hypothetical protein